jgi:predicted house-cleaning noncanonical NTP pyrophosphatase (MazG superfamily)
MSVRVNTGSQKMKIIPTEFEIYDEETPDLLMGKIKGFDEESLSVEISSIMTSKDMQELAIVLEKVEQLYKDGI